MPLSQFTDLDSISAAGPAARYKAAIAAGEIKEDLAQAKVIARLEWLHRDLGSYRPQPAAAAKAGWQRWFKRDVSAPVLPPKGLYIHGPVGRGKSMVMDLFFAATRVEKKRRVHFHAFMAEIHQRRHQLGSGAGKVDDPLARIAEEIATNCWLLCFDEFVVNNIVDAMILGRLFEQMFSRGVVIVATSNFAPQDLYKDGLQRDRFEPFIAMIEARMEVLSLAGPHDYRRDRLLGETVYLTPDTARSRDDLQRIWDRLTDDEPGAPTDLAVLGRRIEIGRAACGCAWMGFDDLCSANLGANDYLALGKAFHTLFLVGIPLMSQARHDEARRFITLIDALYEARTRLVCIAAAPPDALFPEGVGAFEFTRTASRLAEMQSADWLALER